MACFPDLSPHTYSPACGLNLFNVGWLDEGMAFATGSSSADFQFALQSLCRHPIFIDRGSHACSYCGGMHRENEGNAQIRVCGKHGTWYAAPTLIHHYVTRHQYLPPDEFIEAVILTARVAAKPAYTSPYSQKNSGPYLLK
jgi:hypothetical protein